jgi:sugar phosphate isomerase/epimerase
MKRWIDIAAKAGAKRIRIIAGDAPADEKALRRSSEALAMLGAYASNLQVMIVSENFRPLTSTGAACVELLRLTKGSIGFITDFGNFKAPDKYEEFMLILPHSASVHAKAHYDEWASPTQQNSVYVWKV